MIDGRVTKRRLLNHLHYSKWYYLLALAGSLLVFALLYDITEPKVPGNQKVQILVLDYYLTGDTGAWQEEILAHLPEDQREVRFVTLAAGITNTSENLELIQARIVTRLDDIFLMDVETYKLLASTGAFLPLDRPSQPDGVPFLERITLPEGVDPAALTVQYETLDDAGNLIKEEGICGVSMIGVRGMLYLGVVPDNMVAAVASYSENQENALETLAWIFENKQEGPELATPAG